MANLYKSYLWVQMEIDVRFLKTAFILNIGAQELITILVLKFVQVLLTTCWIFLKTAGWVANTVKFKLWSDPIFCGILFGSHCLLRPVCYNSLGKYHYSRKKQPFFQPESTFQPKNIFFTSPQKRMLLVLLDTCTCTNK